MTDEKKKLKTLKDIALFRCDACGYDSEELREAAREWIEELEKYYLGGYTFGDKWYSSDEGIDLAVGWIKYFFNLEEKNEID